MEKTKMNMFKYLVLPFPKDHWLSCHHVYPQQQLSDKVSYKYVHMCHVLVHRSGDKEDMNQNGNDADLLSYGDNPEEF